VDLADIHGQDRFNFKHAAISRDDSKSLLDWAFRLDYERNGPSLYRLTRTMLEGWRRYRNDPDPRVRERFRLDGHDLRAGYGAALFAMEKYLRQSNQEIAEKIRTLRKDMEREMGALTSWVNHLAGPVLLWAARHDARKYPRGRTVEPMTFFDRRNWPETA
jgi:hypothetical protein